MPQLLVPRVGADPLAAALSVRRAIRLRHRQVRRVSRRAGDAAVAARRGQDADEQALRRAPLVAAPDKIILADTLVPAAGIRSACIPAFSTSLAGSTHARAHTQGLHVLLAFGFCERRNVGVVVDGALVQALLGVLVTHACLALFNELLALFTMWGSFGTQRHQLIILIIRLCAKLLFSSALGYFYAGLIADAPFAEQHVELATWMDDVLLEHTAFCAVAAAYAGPAALSALGQALPCISTWVRTWRPPFAALVDLFEPTNALFVGKKARSRPIEIPPPARISATS